MVDRHRDKLRGRPTGSEMVFQKDEKGGRIAAAGNRDDSAARKIDIEEQSGVVVRFGFQRQHDASARSCLTRSFRDAEALG